MDKTKKKEKASIAMFLVTIGIVYGDIGTSPLYVMKSILDGNGGIATASSELIIGSLSLVIWTITLLTTIKYVLIAMKADNNGEGGIFSLYSLVKSKGKWLIVPAMIGGSALLADGVLTPAVTVTNAVEGLRSMERMDAFLGTGQGKVVLITLVIIVTLFSVQHSGTSRIGKAFGPVMFLWFSFLAVFGVVNIFRHPAVLAAFNPIHAIKLLISPANKAGFMILGSIFLAATGAEALYSDMGHVGRENIYRSWPFVKICLITNYLGQGAWIIQNTEGVFAEEPNPFFMMLPLIVRPFAVILSAAAAIIASQALITGSYTLVSEATRLDLMPHLKTEYPSETKGQIYIPVVNWVLLIGCSLVVLYFRSGSRMEAAYGLSITVTMLMTTLLLTVYLAKVKGKPAPAILMCIVFGAIEAVFFISSLGKFTKGGYFAVLIALVLVSIMIIWLRGTAIEKKNSIKLRLADYRENLDALRHDVTIDRSAHNLVFIERGNDMETVERDTLYSILDKDLKRADAYWFISIQVLDIPYVVRYHVETFGTDYIFRVNLELGFKNHHNINVYIRRIVGDLLASGELPKQDRRYSIYGPSDVGTFRFVIIKKTVPTSVGLSSGDEAIMKAKYFIRNLAGSQESLYGLDTSAVITEYVPLVINGTPETSKIERI
jgi:KUP system potassium uptake protein